MQTYFAPAERSSDSQLRTEIEEVSQSPLMDSLLTLTSGLLAVLNERRQILALNESLLETLGAGDAARILGLRMGEAIGCVHAGETEGGCGTTELCSTCGQALAIVTSLSKNEPVARTCAIKTRRNGRDEDLFFRVQCCPTELHGQRLLLVFLQDITHQQKWQALERAFFHDVNNLLAGLLGSVELSMHLQQQGAPAETEHLYDLSLRLAKEVEMQRCLTQDSLANYRPVLQPLSVVRIMQAIRNLFRSHPAAEDRRLVLPEPVPDLSLTTDRCFFLRVLENMIINALEASDAGDEVRVSCESSDTTVTFSVWNRQAIPREIAGRIFQRNFSTKEDQGRGLGTYSMKLFGEQFLGGRVSFTSSESEGTVFRFSLDVERPAQK